MIEKYCILGRNKARRDVVKSDGSLGGVTIPGSPDRAKFKKRRNLFVNLEKLRSTA